jgi:ParB-like chromosome segregation protein Spo0J
MDHLESDLVELPLASLTFNHALREFGIDGSHVQALAELGGRWQPILVWGPENLVVDGQHRVAAARKLGFSSIRARTIAGSEIEAIAESIRLNVFHGLPLTLRDRVRAAERLSARVPEWSDRRIAAVCGISAPTVAKVRRAESGSSSDERVGLDGKRRPAKAGVVRQRVLEALQANPAGSLRAIAAVANTSPETVRLVRKTMSLVSDHVSPIRAEAGAASVQLQEPNQVDGVDRTAWRNDHALTTCANAEDLLEWLESGAAVYDWPAYTGSVPLSRIYEIADEAQRRSAEWGKFARALQVRPLRRPVAS